jgi:hypothetical protein
MTFSRLPGDVVVCDGGTTARERGRGDSGRKARGPPLAPLATGRHGPRTPPERAVALDATVDRADVAGDASAYAAGSDGGVEVSPAARRSRADTLSRASASDEATRSAIFSAGVRGRDDDDDGVSPFERTDATLRDGDEWPASGDERFGDAGTVGGVAETRDAVAFFKEATGDA